MLQFNKSRPVGQLEPPAAELISPAEVYEAAVGFFRRQHRVIAIAIVLALLLGVVYVASSPATYTGRAVLVMDPHKAQVFQSPAPIGELPMDSAAVDTQLEVINSDNVALSVIKDLHLDEDPEFISPRTGLFGTVFGLAAGAVNDVLNTFLPATADAPAPDDLMTQRALNTFLSHLKVKRVSLTYAIEIDFDSLSPERAALIANAVADAYVVDSLEAKYQTTKRASAWLQDRLRELREESFNAERAVVDYKAKNNMVDTGGRLMNQQQLAEFNSELIQARAQTAEAKARLDRVQEILTAGDIDPSAANTATVADTLHNDVISKLRSQYLEYDGRASDWAQKYGPNHLAVINLRNQMSELRRAIAEELKRTAETYKSDYEIAKQREQSIQRSLDQIITDSQSTNEAAVTLHNLESNAQTYRALYDNFLQRYMESVQQQSFPISEARIISRAKRPLAKSSPKSHLALALAGLAGLILGTGFGMLRDISDRVFRTSSQIAEHLKADCIALIPFTKTTPSSARGATPAGDIWESEASILKGGLTPEKERSASKRNGAPPAKQESLVLDTLVPVKDEAAPQEHVPMSPEAGPATGTSAATETEHVGISVATSPAPETVTAVSSEHTAMSAEMDPATEASPAATAEGAAKSVETSSATEASTAAPSELVAMSAETEPVTEASEATPADHNAMFTQAGPSAEAAGTERATHAATCTEDGSASETAAIEQPTTPFRPSPRLISRDSNPRWMVIDAPLSRYAEAIRAIKVATDLEHVGKLNKVIGITSSLPNEGKSTVAASLAALVAHGGRRAVLVDCDLRNPSLSKALAPKAKVGILDVISGKVELDDAYWKEEVSGLTFLPAVVPRRLVHSSEILASEPTRALFEKLRRSFDYVIVDLSPLAPVVDVRVITSLIDSFIFVVEWGRTKIDVVEHALVNAPGVYDNLLGVVLNKTKMNALSRYENYRGNYYHNQYYSRYGYGD